MGKDNKLYHPASGVGIGACRAYFKIGGGAASARQITSFNIDFGDGTTGLIEFVKKHQKRWIYTFYYKYNYYICNKILVK